MKTEISSLDSTIKFFNRLKDSSDLLIEVAERSIEKIKTRIGKGESSESTVMDTNSSNRIGRYSKAHANVRGRYARGILVRDLNLSGDMVADFAILEKRKNYVSVGFSSKIQADKAEYNERYMGVEAFSLSANEKEDAVLFFEESLKEEMLKI
jgi:hypothetical protein